MNSEIIDRFNQIHSSIGKTNLIVVSKYCPLEQLLLIINNCSHRDFGESKVQDLKKRVEDLSLLKIQDVRWHFLGKLQRNKVKELFQIPNLCAIHSLDSIKLYEEMRRHSALLKAPVKLFIQFKTTQESEKSGVATTNELYELVDYMLNHKVKNLDLHGLMTMGSIRDDDFEEAAHKSFQSLRDIAILITKEKGLELKLSMGMSSDYKIALAYGSDYLRIGGAIFSP